MNNTIKIYVDLKNSGKRLDIFKGKHKTVYKIILKKTHRK